ncbi:MAG: 30S ribosomal protein S20 [Oscillospiraceae bacterium]|nr:30S ribosomal protein S20 [Oscillospiraceae bacterium]
MPNIKSAKKRVKIIEKKKLQNKILMSQVKTIVKKVHLVAKSGSEDKKSVLQIAMKKLDQSVKKGIIHKNCAARKKSQLARLCK